MNTLIYILSELYPKEDDIRRVAFEAKLPVVHIDFAGSAYSMWFNVLRIGRISKKLDNITEIALNDYNTHGENQWTDWLNQAQGDHEDYLGDVDYRYYYGPDHEEKKKYLKEAEEHYLASNVKRDIGNLTLRNRRPKSELPTDFKSTVFNRSYSSDNSPQSIIDLMGEFKGSQTAMCCCIIAHYSFDVECSLLEAAEVVACNNKIDPEKHNSIWISGDELWRSPERKPNEKFRVDWPVLNQLRPASTSFDAFIDGFREMLDELNLLFILDFSGLTNNDLKKEEANIERYVELIDGITSFSGDVVAKGHRVVIGLPRIALGSKTWREFIETIPDTFLASELFYSNLSAGIQDALHQLSPRNVDGALKALSVSNSYSLTKKINKETEALIRRNLINNDQQLKGILSIAANLSAEGYLEPAYRIETWVKFILENAEPVQLAADILPDPNKKDEGYGILENISDLPRTCKYAVVTGPSGQGKTMALKYIHKEWCLPKRVSRGIKHPAWLPIYFSNVKLAADQVAVFFQKEATIYCDNPVFNNTKLTAYLNISRVATEDNLGYIFNSPLLYLIDDVDFESDIANWMEDKFNADYLTTGLIIAARSINEINHSYENSIMEVRLRPLDIVQAKNLSLTAHKKFIEQIYSTINVPLNTYIRNLYLIKCIKKIKKTENLSNWCSLYDLLDSYVKNKCDGLSSAEITELVEQQLPVYAYDIYSKKETKLLKQFATMAIRHRLISPVDSKEFKHPLILDYFLARFISKNWENTKEEFLGSFTAERFEVWESRNINLLKMIFACLRKVQRELLLAFLSDARQYGIAHKCLLEIPPTGYEEIAIAKEICLNLISDIQVQEELTNGNLSKFLNRKKIVADALGYYDSRFPEIKNTLDSFIPLYKNSEGNNLFAGKFLVSNLEFFRFMKDRGYETKELWHPSGWTWREDNNIQSPAYWTNINLSKPNYPVVGISFYEALAYAKWLNQKVNDETKNSFNFSLPTELEWSLAAGLGDLSLLSGAVDNSNNETEKGDYAENINESILNRVNKFLQDNRLSFEIPEVKPIGVFEANNLGIFDIMGNVWQWCDEYYQLTTDLPSGTEYISHPVLVRGGPVIGKTRWTSSLLGGPLDPFSRVNNVGMRLICKEILD